MSQNTQNLIALLVELAADPDLMSRFNDNRSGFLDDLAESGFELSDEAQAALANGDADAIRAALGSEFLSSLGHVQTPPSSKPRPGYPPKKGGSKPKPKKGRSGR